MSFTHFSSPTEDGKVLLKWSVILLVCVGLIAAAGIFVLNNIPAIGEQLPANTAPIIVTLAQPHNYQGSVWSNGISLNIQAFAEVPISRLELWANGELVADYEPAQGTTISWEPNWTPGAVGEFSVFARVFDIHGNSAPSNVLNFSSFEAPAAFLSYTVQEGDDFAGIAEQFLISPADLEQANPDTELTPGAVIVIPFEQMSAPPPRSDATSGEPGPVSPSNNAIDDLKFWLTDLIGSPADLPSAPTISAAFSSQAGQCSVQLSIADLDAKAFGYFIYQAGSGDTFERIATLSKGNSASLGYLDHNQHGQLTYYAAAFNPSGETPSAPVSLDLSSLGCGGTSTTAGLQLHGGMLTIPGDFDSVYFYTSINYGNWQRVPALDGWFLPVEDQQVEIAPLITDFDQLPVNTSLHLEAWGWAGGELYRIGVLDTVLSTTGLYGCPTPGQCLQGLGWTNVITKYPEAEGHQVELSWTTSAPGADGGIWQVSTQPFPEAFTLTPPGLLLSGPAGAAAGGNPSTGTRFVLDIGDLADLIDGTAQAGMIVPEIETDWLLTELSLSSQLAFIPRSLGIEDPGLVFYVRVIPLAGNQAVGEPSNPVTIYYQPEGEHANPLVEYPVPPDIYDIQIVEFTPIIPPTLSWGCMVIEEIDYNTFVSNYYSFTESPEDAYERYLAAMNNHTPICPSYYKGMGSKPWYKQFWDFASSALSWVSEVYNSIKSEVISTIASALDALPLVECGSGCEALLTQGLNAGMVALGIPPELPNLDQLTEQGMGYLVQTVAAEAGIDCDETCQEIIRSGIEEFVEQSQQATVNAICQDAEYAHAHGKEPLCLPAGVTAVPAPGSVTQPATVTIQISRRPEPVEVDEMFMDDYTYDIGFPATNDLGVDFLSVQVNTGFYEGSYSATYYGASLAIDNPLQSQLFYSLQGSIPPMQPGESQTITFGLQPVDYWLPGHQDLIEQAGGFVLYNDYWTLYDGAHLEITAEVICPWYDPIYQPTIQCGGSDFYEYPVPLSRLINP